MEYLHSCDSPVGALTIASNGEAVTGLWLAGQKYYAATLERETETAALPIFSDVENWLDAYFSGERPAPLPLAPRGSSFRRAVWKILCDIPYGEVTTYGDIAKKVARKMGLKSMSARAVGGAVGHNPISILIPCHRVVGADGSLTGYAGGVASKIKLLTVEGALSEGEIFGALPKKGAAL